MISNMAPDVREKAKNYFRLMEQAIAQEVEERKLIPGMFPALRPCNFLCVLTHKHLHAVFTDENAGQLPLQVWIDGRENPPPPEPEYEFVQHLAAYQYGLKNFFPFYEDAAIVDATPEAQVESANLAGKEWVEAYVKHLTKPKAIAGYAGLQPALDASTLR